MKYRWIIISLSVVFFLTALTIYVNRVIFPTVVKKIAIEQAQNFLKRKVEIGSIHFNWVRGIVIKKIKIYQKDSPRDVFAEAEKISLGVIFIPGFKQHKLTFPFIKIHSPSLHLIHQANGQWNFSDLLQVPAAKPNERPFPVSVAVGGITVTDGKLRLDDVQPQGNWTELINGINLKVGLSYQGIAFDGSLSIPQKKGRISVQGAWQPLNQSLKASVHLTHITPLDYLNLVPVKIPVTLASATINQADVQIEYAPGRINLQGAWFIKNINVTAAENNIQMDMDVKNADISLGKDAISAKGLFYLTNTQIFTPTSSMAGTFKANIDDFLMNSPEDISVKGSLMADGLNIKLPSDKSFRGQIAAQINQGHWQKDSASFDGSITANRISINLNDQQNIKGDLKLNDIKITKDKKMMTAQTELSLNNLNVRLPGKIFKGNFSSPHFAVSLDNQNDLKVAAPINLENINAIIDKTSLKGSLRLTTLKVDFNQNQQTLDTQAQGLLQQAQVGLEGDKNLNVNANFDFHVLYPLKNPSGLEYNGSLAVENGRFEGLPFGPLNDINLTADIKTDSAVIEDLSLSVLDTPLKASGHIVNFLKPLLDVQVQAGRIDLSKAKEVAPDLLSKYGISVDGEITSFKLKFEGPPLDLSKAKINGEGVLRNVNVESTGLKQSLKDVSGTIKASGDSISWEDFTATVMGKTLTLTGRLTDFKNPEIKTSLASNGIGLDAEINKNDNLVKIKNISGHYLSAQFNANGSVDLSDKIPLINVKSDLTFKLEDLPTIVPGLEKTVGPLKLSGLVTASTSIKGPATDWKKWVSSANVQSDLVTIAGLKFDNLKLDVAQGDGKLNKCNITSNFYDGSLNIVTTADLNDPAISFETAVHLENANLAKLKNDTGAKDEDLRGFIALTTMVNGTVKDILNVKGNGALNISQGYLMEKNFSSLFLIPELSNLIFTDASANFTIENQKISTQDFALKSEGATLNGKGWIGFNHKLQFVLTPEFNADKIIQSDSFKKGPSALIASAAGQYLTITVDGTIDKPVVHTIKKPMELIKKTGEIIKDNVGQILEGIFQ